jgi:hypothetical protein
MWLMSIPLLAFQTDTTRICAERITTILPEPWCRLHDSPSSPHLTPLTGPKKQFFMEQVAYIARKLDTIQKATTALDNTICSVPARGMLTGRSHEAHADLPGVMLGGRGGRSKGSRPRLGNFGPPDVLPVLPP